MHVARIGLLALITIASLSLAVLSDSKTIHQHSPHSGLSQLPAGHYLETELIRGNSPSRRKQRRRKVAIIGAGPTGSSAAYFLKKAQDHLSAANETFQNDKIEITIYERTSRIGGRTAIVYPHDDESYDPVELGASIFADVNYNLRRAVKEFNLETGAQNGLSGQMGIWDGQQFLFEGDASSWWTSAKFFLRYGYSAITVQNLVKKQLSYFTGLYDPSFLHEPERRKVDEQHASVPGYPWSTIEELADAVDASSLAASTGLEYFKDHRVSELFIEEMIEAATRVNYAQDSDQIHGFGALVSLAASGATGLRDGNKRIFEEFVKRSGATLQTGVEGEVTGIVRFNRFKSRASLGEVDDEFDDLDQGPQWYIGTKSGEGQTYDAVVIATPWHNADITLLNTEERVKSKPFVHLHVTLLTTTAPSPRPEYFGLGSQDTVPNTILTSDESVRRATQKKKPILDDPPSDGDDRQPGNPGESVPHLKTRKDLRTPRLDFFSLNYLRALKTRKSDSNDPDAAKEYVVKIFSHEPVSDEQLDRLFGSSTITWLTRHEWDSYPMLTPTTKYPRIQVDENLYYPNAMESLVSTMETSTVSAKNTVGLLLKKWYGNSFVNGDNCKYSSADKAQDPMKNENWAGWGCDSG